MSALRYVDDGLNKMGEKDRISKKANALAIGLLNSDAKGTKRLARAIALLGAVELLTESAKLFTSLRLSKEEVVKTAQYFMQFIEGT